MKHYLGWTTCGIRNGKKNYVFSNVGYSPDGVTVIKLRQARWAKNTARAENYKFFAGKTEGVGWQNLGWKEDTDYVQ